MHTLLLSPFTLSIVHHLQSLGLIGDQPSVTDIIGCLQSDPHWLPQLQSPGESLRQTVRRFHQTATTYVRLTPFMVEQALDKLLKSDDEANIRAYFQSVAAVFAASHEDSLSDIFLLAKPASPPVQETLARRLQKTKVGETTIYEWLGGTEGLDTLMAMGKEENVRSVLELLLAHLDGHPDSPLIESGPRHFLWLCKHWLGQEELFSHMTDPDSTISRQRSSAAKHDPDALRMAIRQHPIGAQAINAWKLHNASAGKRAFRLLGKDLNDLWAAIHKAPQIGDQFMMRINPGSDRVAYTVLQDSPEGGIVLSQDGSDATQTFSREAWRQVHFAERLFEKTFLTQYTMLLQRTLLQNLAGAIMQLAKRRTLINQRRLAEAAIAYLEHTGIPCDIKVFNRHIYLAPSPAPDDAPAPRQILLTRHLRHHNIIVQIPVLSAVQDTNNSLNQTLLHGTEVGLLTLSWPFLFGRHVDEGTLHELRHWHDKASLKIVFPEGGCPPWIDHNLPDYRSEHSVGEAEAYALSARQSAASAKRLGQSTDHLLHRAAEDSRQEALHYDWISLGFNEIDTAVLLQAKQELQAGQINPNPHLAPKKMFCNATLQMKDGTKILFRSRRKQSVARLIDQTLRHLRQLKKRVSLHLASLGGS